MPLTRYQIKQEYGFADPELYRAADKDDPEALLEGVAMAGLVGVLRQLGDLAEFAAEIFHDLHEEVMTTAARGHGLMARVQQLEAEFPSIEKAFLSQTNHSSFFSSSAGADWHPHLRAEQNLITRGDLPRFVMDSYEECRGPPRLFLLDKFDVGGAGACLKRYTDPSFFKAEAVSTGISTVEIQREKKIRKVKKKGSRWRNGETPEVAPTSHAKLHELFLEERVENGHFDPARLVKLKRRQLNGSPLDIKSGKSYMEKILNPSSPEHRIVREVSVYQPASQLTLDDSSESGLEIPEINALSPVKKSLQGKESTCLSPNAEEAGLKPFVAELSGDAIDIGIVRVPDPVADGQMDESPSAVHKMSIEEALAVDADDKREDTLDGDHSDDLTSEVDNYMDALTTMDSEIETDNEYKYKNDQYFLNVRKHGADSDPNEEQLGVQANFSDSLSVGNSSLSDGGNSSSKKGGSGFSYSDSLSNLANNSPSDGEGAAKTFRSTKHSVPEDVDLPSNLPYVHMEIPGTECNKLVVLNDTCTEEKKILDTGEASCDPHVKDVNPMLLPPAPAADSHEISGTELVKESIDSIKLSPEAPSPGTNGTSLADSSAVVSDVPSMINNDALFIVSSDSPPVDDLSHESDAHTSKMLQIVPEKTHSYYSVDEMLQTDYADEGIENLVEGAIAPEHSTTTQTKDLVPRSPLPQVDEAAAVTLVANRSDALRPDRLVSEVDDSAATMRVDSENLTSMADASETVIIKAEKKLEVSGPANGEEIGGPTSAVDLAGDAIPSEPSSCSDRQVPDNHVNLEDVVTESVRVEDVAASATVAGGTKGDIADGVVCPSSDLIFSPSRSLSGIESCSGSEALNEIISPECLSEPMMLMEIKQVEVDPTQLDSSPYKTISKYPSDIEVTEHADDPSLTEQSQNSGYDHDVATVPSSKLSNQELKLKPTYQNISGESGDDVICSTNLPEAGISSEQSMKLQADQSREGAVHLYEVNSNLSNLLISPTYHLAEPGIPSEQAWELQSDEHNEGGVQADEETTSSFNLQSERMRTLAHIDQERSLDTTYAQCLEDLPGDEHLVQSDSQESNAADLAINPFDSLLPSYGIFPEVNHANLEAVPPLPPLPPVQWRIGRVQPATVDSQSGCVDHSQAAFSPMRSFRNDEKAQMDFPSSDGEIVEPSNPFVCLSVADSQRLQNSSAEENPLQPSPLPMGMVTISNDASEQRDFSPLEGKESLNSFSILPEMHIEEPTHGFVASEGESTQTNSNPFSVVPTTENSTAGHSPAPSQNIPVQPLNQLAPEACLEVKGPKQGAQNTERLQGDSPDKSVVPVAIVEEQQVQHMVSTSQGETTWSLSTLALPPASGVGKANGNKLPRPRNPLIDAVAAHDKSKLRKVTERARPQIGPNLEERDSLLEQIRTKSFNLKPAAATRPSIQVIQGPKTNLKVAAILEKANAIRQAFAGSDEDDDSDSWSDS